MFGVPALFILNVNETISWVLCEECAEHKIASLLKPAGIGSYFKVQRLSKIPATVATIRFFFLLLTGFKMK